MPEYLLYHYTLFLIRDNPSEILLSVVHLLHHSYAWEEKASACVLYGLQHSLLFTGHWGAHPMLKGRKVTLTENWMSQSPRSKTSKA